MKWIVGLAAVLFCCDAAIAQEPVIGRASVIDGDTIEISGARIRLNGIDSPESWQICQDGVGGDYRCGRVAALALDRFLAASRPARCEIVDRDRYQRLVGVCFRADGLKVNEWLVANGFAVDWTRYSAGAYASVQERARKRKLGIWQGEFQQPCEARGQRTKQTSAC
ncbi:thermonuclease family protein [Ensifer sp. NPDC090286]|uniref:thermonuclease family protein n=1 Tax=Ensifer sp. NPDC090286 TaxID=3363991 RepID=UPI003839EC55